MKKVAIVSCDKWINKIEEDRKLKDSLITLGYDAEIISWQQPLNQKYDLMILRSVWGYQNDYDNFKDWLLYIDGLGIPLLNSPDMIMNNIRKNIQFSILSKNSIPHIDTTFLSSIEIGKGSFLDGLSKSRFVVKPSISGSGENTFIVDESANQNYPNTIEFKKVYEIFDPILSKNKDCYLMVQPYIEEINNGEYSCIFIDGELTHTMLRFPSVFHEKKKTYLINNVPNSIIELARRVEEIPEFKNYLYMRVDMVLINGVAKIMEVELAEPDFLTRYIEDEAVRDGIINVVAKRISRRIN